MLIACLTSKRNFEKEFAEISSNIIEFRSLEVGVTVKLIFSLPCI